MQCFPRDAWEAEFALAAGIGLQAIELFVETEHNPANPVWNVAGRARLRELSAEHGLAIDTLCCDCFMRASFAHQGGAAARLLEQLLGFGFSRLVLPFFEHGELKNEAEREAAARVLQAFRGSGVELALESSLRPAALMPLADAIAARVCYDLGNTTALGHDVPQDIAQLGSRISHVHVKDKRRSDGRNVRLGSGDTRFDAAFAALHAAGYAGSYSLETDRGDDPVVTARDGVHFVRQLLAQATGAVAAPPTATAP